MYDSNLLLSKINQNHKRSSSIFKDQFKDPELEEEFQNFETSAYNKSALIICCLIVIVNIFLIFYTHFHIPIATLTIPVVIVTMADLALFLMYFKTKQSSKMNYRVKYIKLIMNSINYFLYFLIYLLYLETSKQVILLLCFYLHSLLIFFEYLFLIRQTSKIICFVIYLIYLVLYLLATFTTYTLYIVYDTTTYRRVVEECNSMINYKSFVTEDHFDLRFFLNNTANKTVFLINTDKTIVYKNEKDYLNDISNQNTYNYNDNINITITSGNFSDGYFYNVWDNSTNTYYKIYFFNKNGTYQFNKNDSSVDSNNDSNGNKNFSSNNTSPYNSTNLPYNNKDPNVIYVHYIYYIMAMNSVTSELNCFNFYNSNYIKWQFTYDPSFDLRLLKRINYARYLAEIISCLAGFFMIYLSNFFNNYRIRMFIKVKENKLIMNYFLKLINNMQSQIISFDKDKLLFYNESLKTKLIDYRDLSKHSNTNLNLNIKNKLNSCKTYVASSKKSTILSSDDNDGISNKRVSIFNNKAMNKFKSMFGFFSDTTNSISNIDNIEDRKNESSNNKNNKKENSYLEVNDSNISSNIKASKDSGSIFNKEEVVNYFKSFILESISPDFEKYLFNNDSNNSNNNNLSTIINKDTLYSILIRYYLDSHKNFSINKTSFVPTTTDSLLDLSKETDEDVGMKKEMRRKISKKANNSNININVNVHNSMNNESASPLHTLQLNTKEDFGLIKKINDKENINKRNEKINIIKPETNKTTNTLKNANVHSNININANNNNIDKYGNFQLLGVFKNTNNKFYKVFIRKFLNQSNISKINNNDFNNLNNHSNPNTTSINKLNLNDIYNLPNHILNTSKYSSIHKQTETYPNNFITDIMIDDITEIKQAERISFETKLKQKLFSKMAHEFKTPLIVIKSLITDLIDPDIIDKDKISAYIYYLSDYITFLINDIIYYSNEKEIKTYKEEIDLVELIEFCEGVTQSLIAVMPGDKKNVCVLTGIEDFAAHGVKIFSDKTKLKQIMLNLISNSVKFTKFGSISITAEIEFICDCGCGYIQGYSLINDSIYDGCFKKKILIKEKEENKNDNENNIKINNESLSKKISKKSIISKKNILLEEDIINDSSRCSNNNKDDDLNYKDNMSVFNDSCKDSIIIDNLNDNKEEVYRKKVEVEEKLHNNIADKFKFDTAHKKPQLIIRITDTGIGIKQKDLLLIKTSNTQEQPLSINTDYAYNEMGTGIGLGITKNLLKAMNHKIEIDSEYGKGTSIKIIIDSVNLINSSKDSNSSIITNSNNSNTKDFCKMSCKTAKFDLNNNKLYSGDYCLTENDKKEHYTQTFRRKSCNFCLNYNKNDRDHCGLEGNMDFCINCFTGNKDKSKLSTISFYNRNRNEYSLGDRNYNQDNYDNTSNNCLQNSILDQTQRLDMIHHTINYNFNQYNEYNDYNEDSNILISTKRKYSNQMSNKALPLLKLIKSNPTDNNATNNKKKRNFEVLYNINDARNEEPNDILLTKKLSKTNNLYLSSSSKRNIQTKLNNIILSGGAYHSFNNNPNDVNNYLDKNYNREYITMNNRSSNTSIIKNDRKSNKSNFTKNYFNCNTSRYNIKSNMNTDGVTNSFINSLSHSQSNNAILNNKNHRNYDINTINNIKENTRKRFSFNKDCNNKTTSNSTIRNMESKFSNNNVVNYSNISNKNSNNNVNDYSHTHSTQSFKEFTSLNKNFNIRKTNRNRNSNDKFISSKLLSAVKDHSDAVNIINTNAISNTINNNPISNNNKNYNNNKNKNTVNSTSGIKNYGSLIINNTVNQYIDKKRGSYNSYNSNNTFNSHNSNNIISPCCSFSIDNNSNNIIKKEKQVQFKNNINNNINNNANAINETDNNINKNNSIRSNDLIYPRKITNKKHYNQNYLDSLSNKSNKLSKIMNSSINNFNNVNTKANKHLTVTNFTPIQENIEEITSPCSPLIISNSKCPSPVVNNTNPSLNRSPILKTNFFKEFQKSASSNNVNTLSNNLLAINNNICNNNNNSLNINTPHINNMSNVNIINNNNKILIVDDTETIRNSLRKLLLKNPISSTYSIVEAKDGVEMLNLVIADQTEGNKIKVIITDENMEYMSGSTAISIIRKLENESKVHSIFIASLTAFTDEDTRNEIMKKGANTIISKPISVHDLNDLIEKSNISIINSNNNSTGINICISNI